MRYNLFSSGFFRFFSRVADLMLLNILFLVCCLPIITVGASLSALYSVCLKLVRHQEAYLTKDFFRAFRHNLKQGIILDLILSAGTTIVITDLAFVCFMFEASPLYKGVFFVMALLALFFLMTSLYIYPLLAQFTNTVSGYIRNAAILSIKNFRYTVMFLLLAALPIIAAVLFPAALLWEILLFLLFGFSGMAYIYSIFLSAIFEPFLEKNDDPSPEA